MSWGFLLSLAVSSSLDNFGVGLSYGIQQIRIRFFSNLLISAVCFGFSCVGILFGGWISDRIPRVFPLLCSVLLLLAIGFRIVWLSLPRSTPQKTAAPPKGPAAIFSAPECMDFDRSREIGTLEALALGAALSTNALTNGLSAGLVGCTPFVLSLVTALGSFAAIRLGVALGQRAAHIRIGAFSLGQFGAFLSGVLLVLIAVNSCIMGGLF